MVGILAGFWLFSCAVKLGNWLDAYYFCIVVALIFLAIIFLIKMPELAKVSFNLRAYLGLHLHSLATSLLGGSES